MAKSDDTNAAFHETRWSVVLAAGESASAQSDAALENLCRSYWPPLYAFARRQGHSPEQAQDLTQAFFAEFLGRKGFAASSPERGRFRSFLLSSFKHFLINEWHRERAQKRGGGQILIPLDVGPSEERYQVDLIESSTPESVFERHWAFTVLDRTFARLAAEYAATGKAALFDLLKETLTGDKRATPRAEIAARCGSTVGAVDVAVHRLRRRYGELLREEIADTIDAAGDVDDEIRRLKAVLGGA